MKTKKQFINRILSLVLAFVMVVGLMPMTTFALKNTPALTQITEQNRGSYGLSADYIGYYAISTAEDLYEFAALVNKNSSEYNGINGVLTSNITVNTDVLNDDGTLKGTPGKVWTPIGSTNDRYTGVFDGNHKTISGLYFNDSDASDVGLFGHIQGVDCIVKNLGVVDSYINGKTGVGGVVGASYQAAVDGCYNAGTVIGKSYVGGVVGTTDVTLNNCYNTGTVSGTDANGSVGGVVGSADGAVNGCYNAGTVSGVGDGVGGVAGVFGSETAVISNCYNSGFVSSNGNGYVGNNVGGVVGYALGKVTNCYNTGTVSSTEDNVGGVVGDTINVVTKCYNIGAVSGNSGVGGVVGDIYGNGSVSECYNTGTVSSQSGSIGGVVGEANVKVENCYNTGSVSNLLYTSVGGVVGFSQSQVNWCYNVGSINADTKNYDKNRFGGIVGTNGGNVTNCYYLDDAFTIDGNDYGEAMTDSAMTDNSVMTGKFSAYSTDIWGKKTNGTYDKSQGGYIGYLPYLKNVNGSDPSLLIQYMQVTFEANSGTGNMSPVKVAIGAEYTLPNCTYTAPIGYQFKGWANSANGSVIGEGKITVNTNTTLYAIWEKIPAEVPNAQTSGNLTLTYGDSANQKITVSVEEKDGYTYSYQWIENTQVIGTTDTLSIPNGLAVGNYDYACVVFAKRNDNGETASVTLKDIRVKVNPKSLNSANIVLNETMFTYNGNEQKPTVTVICSGKTLIEDTDYNVIWPTDCKNAGNKTVTINFKGNYSGSAQKTFKIKKAPLTVTANNKTITYGDAPANNGVIYSGFVANENTQVLGGTLAYSYTYSQYGNVGDYDIFVSGLTADNYEITFVKGTLTVEQKEISIQWGATEFIPYNGSKQLPKATAGNLINGDSCVLTVNVVETTNGAGIIPGRWNAKITALSNGNYCLPKDGRLVQVDYSISKGYQDAPTVSGIDETVKGKADGKILGLTTEMEYATEYTSDDNKYTKVTDANMSFAAGTYYVRYQEKDYYNASAFVAVTIGDGRKLTVTIPQNQVGYTLTVDKSEFEYMGGPKILLNIHEGYSKTSNFAVKINGNDMHWGDYTEIDTQGLMEDIVITVEGVSDITLPDAEINIKNNKWTSFWNNITGGLFFKETQDVTITAIDKGSGIKSIKYYFASGELQLNQVETITDWEDYNGTFKINPNNHFVIYVKIIDNAGNTLFINSDSITLDSIAPTLEGIEDGKAYYGDLIVIKSDEQFQDINNVTLDGVPMGFAEGTYGLIPADNGEHTVVVEDKAGNKTTYTVTVYKNYTVTFKVDGQILSTETVGHGKDATLPTVPTKEGYTQTAPIWDKDGKNITADTEINAVYTVNEYTITFMDESGIYKTFSYKHGETVIMPEVPTKDGYTVQWETTIDKATDDATIKAVYTEIPKPHIPNSPQTGDYSMMWLWVALLLVSGGAVIMIIGSRKAFNQSFSKNR